MHPTKRLPRLRAYPKNGLGVPPRVPWAGCPRCGRPFSDRLLLMGDSEPYTSYKADVPNFHFGRERQGWDGEEEWGNGGVGERSGRCIVSSRPVLAGKLR